MPQSIRATRDLLLDQLAAAVAARADAGPDQPVPTTREISDLAAALESADRVLVNEGAQTPGPRLDVEKLGGAVWAAVENAGGSSDVGRAAVLALQQAAGK